LAYPHFDDDSRDEGYSTPRICGGAGAEEVAALFRDLLPQTALETPGRMFAAKHKRISKKIEEISTHEMATIAELFPLSSTRIQMGGQTAMIRIEGIPVVAARLDAQKAKSTQARNKRRRTSKSDGGKAPLAIHSALNSKTKVA
jgi:hypothetical protein